MSRRLVVNTAVHCCSTVEGYSLVSEYQCSRRSERLHTWKISKGSADEEQKDQLRNFQLRKLGLKKNDSCFQR